MLNPTVVLFRKSAGKLVKNGRKHDLKLTSHAVYVSSFKYYFIPLCSTTGQIIINEFCRPWNYDK